jgi:peptidoglycan/LPS O-acetylase OafA/YrhL
LTRRVQGLDILRAGAVFLVLGRHLPLTPDSGSFMRIWERGGWVGVDLFFVLSGYLVSGLLFDEYGHFGSIDRKRFLIRRGLKIYPPFWLMILITTIVSLAARWPLSRRGLLAEGLFVQNYFAGVWGHTWSLAVEEHFYLLIVGLLPVVLRRNHSSLPSYILWLAVGCLAMRGVTNALVPTYDHRIHLYPTHLRVDSLAFGVLLSYLTRFRDLAKRLQAVPTSALVLAGLTCLSPAFVFQLETTWWIPVIGLTIFSLGSGALVLAAVRMPSATSGLAKALAAVGAASYSIYLWHLPVIRWGMAFRKVAELGEAPRAVVLIAVAVLVGYGASKAIEYPVLLIRDRLFPAPTADSQGR